jgi:hypothetical protein
MSSIKSVDLISLDRLIMRTMLVFHWCIMHIVDGRDLLSHFRFSMPSLTVLPEQ